MSALFEDGFFVRKPAWHGLGVVLQDYPGREEAMRLAGHDFEIVEVAQVYDFEREELLSALNEVQSLERLHLQAAEEVDQMVPLLVGRTRKKFSTILPLVLEFVADMKRPLLDKIDTVHYSQQARVLKEAEDYAVRLLEHSRVYTDEPRKTTEIPARLVNRYPDHSFVIDREEASQFLRLMDPPSREVTDAMSDLADYLTDNRFVAIGRFDAKSTS